MLEHIIYQNFHHLSISFQISPYSLIIQSIGIKIEIYNINFIVIL